jgi:hypothetical protein
MRQARDRHPSLDLANFLRDVTILVAFLGGGDILEYFISSGSKRRILIYLLKHPDEEYHLRVSAKIRVPSHSSLSVSAPGHFFNFSYCISCQGKKLGCLPAATVFNHGV